MKTSSWKTTLFGVLAAVGLGLTSFAPPNSTVAKVGGVVAAVGALGTGKAAKDNTAQ